MYYSKGAYQISSATFNLVGVTPHVWAQWNPWFTILLASVFYLMVILASRFIKYNLYKDLQDEVCKSSEYLLTDQVSTEISNIRG